MSFRSKSLRSSFFLYYSTISFYTVQKRILNIRQGDNWYIPIYQNFGFCCNHRHNTANRKFLLVTHFAANQPRKLI